MIVRGSWPYNGDGNDGRPGRRQALSPAALAFVIVGWAVATLTVLVVLVLKLLV